MRKKPSPHIIWSAVVAVLLCGWLTSFRSLTYEIEHQKTVVRTVEAEAHTANRKLQDLRILNGPSRKAKDLPEEMKTQLETFFSGSKIEDGYFIQIGRFITLD